MRTLIAAVLFLVLLASPAGAKAPKACTRALNNAEQIIQLNVEAATAAQEFFDAIQESALLNAGTADAIAFVSDITAAINNYSAAIRDIADRAESPVRSYRANSLSCRKA